MSAADESHGPGAQLQRRLLDAAATGELNTIETLLKAGANVDSKNDKGWTPLMLSARNGHDDVIKRLLGAGCDPDVLNGSGQKALDIAVFWNHRGAATLLGDGDKDASIPSTSGNHVNFYCGGHLDRCAHKRKDNAWLDAKFNDDSTQIIIFIELKPVIAWKNTNLEDMKSAFLYRFSQRDIAHLNGKILNKVFLGTGQIEPSGANSDNTDIAWFAVNLSKMNEEEQEGLLTPAKAEVLEPMPGSMHLVHRDSAIFAQARTMLAWQDRYQFCATCGSAAEPGEGGHKMTCKDENCRSKKGVHNTSYPRSDPSVIMAVISRDRKRLLLGRGSRFPRGMYSCLAGFMEPGESIEDACRREVKEESGVVIGHVQYHSSAPWPFPASLMIGCLAFAENEDIQVDADELEDARWFSRAEVLKMLHRNHPEGMFVPPEQAIAHVLIRAWVNMASNL